MWLQVAGTFKGEEGSLEPAKYRMLKEIMKLKKGIISEVVGGGSLRSKPSMVVYGYGWVIND